MLATPVPARLTVEVVPVAELLTMVSLPVRLPAVVGLKVIGIASVCPDVSVFGKAVAAIENPVPVTAMELIVREPVPDEVRVSDRALDVPSVTLP